MEPRFVFECELYLWKPEGSWVFVDVPVDVADVIDDLFPRKAGFGSVPVRVVMRGFSWETSIFPDKASGSFVLPLKKLARQQASVDVGDQVEIELTIRLP